LLINANFQPAIRPSILHEGDLSNYESAVLVSTRIAAHCQKVIPLEISDTFMYNAYNIINQIAALPLAYFAYWKSQIPMFFMVIIICRFWN